LAPTHERNPILLSESSMAEWLDPNNLEEAELTTQDFLREISDESDRIAPELEFCSADRRTGNIRLLG
jgi:putative SOS response-associated peptidase YedK